MPFAVTHVLAAIILIDLYRDYFAKRKKYFTLHTVFVAGVAGLIPDIDIPLNYFSNSLGIEILHRGFTHTLLFGLIFLIPAFIFWSRKRHKEAMYFFVISFGILLHIFLDYSLSPDGSGLMLFYPFSSATYALNLIKNSTPTFYAGIDAIILLLWLWHEEIKHKISDYI